MLIEREHYLELLRKGDILSQQNAMLSRENSILVEELERLKITNFQLMHKFNQMEIYSQALNQKIVNQNNVIHCDLKGYIGQLTAKQNQMLQHQFQALQNSSFQKYKLLEIKNTAVRIENHQLLQFCNKIKQLYRKIFQKNEEPSLKDLYKWLKGLAGQSLVTSESKNKIKKMEDTGTSFKQNRKVKCQKN